MEGIKQASEMCFVDAPSSARRKASSGDVIISTVRTYLKAVAAVTDEYADCVFSTGFAVLRARHLDRSFLKWMVLNELLIQAIEAHSKGLCYPVINASALVKLKSVIPPPEEQATIAATLDRETARIDALVEKKTRFIELLKEKRQALITHAVTKGLDPNVKMKDSGVEWIGQVPEHWEVKRLRHVGRYSNSGVDKKSYEDQQTVELCNYTDVYYNEFINDDMPFMQATASSHEIEQFTLRKGDVIITKDSEDPSDIGIPAFVRHDMPGVVCGYHLTMIRALNDNYGSYIHRSLQSDHTKAHFFGESPGITRYGLNQNTIGNAPVALPPPEEQASIAATLDRETARIDALISKAEQSITLLKERRTAFITAAVTGQIDLRGKQ